LTGFEGELRHAFSATTALTLFGDRVRGRLKEGGNLPRLPADRLGVRLEQQLTAGLSGELSLLRVQRQDRLAEFETQTPGYNLLDAEARQHSSPIKGEVVLPGRNLTLGTRFTF